MLKNLREHVFEIRLSHDLYNLKQTRIRLELDLVRKCAFHAAVSQRLGRTGLAIGMTASGFTIRFIDVLLARVVQIVVVELVCNLETPLTEHVETTRRLEALSVWLIRVKAKNLVDAFRLLTLVQEVSDQIEVGLLTFDDLTFLDIVDQDVQNLQACLCKIQMILIISSNSILKLPLLEIDHPGWWAHLACGLDGGLRRLASSP